MRFVLKIREIWEFLFLSRLQKLPVILFLTKNWAFFIYAILRFGKDSLGINNFNHGRNRVLTVLNQTLEKGQIPGTSHFPKNIKKRTPWNIWRLHSWLIAVQLMVKIVVWTVVRILVKNSTYFITRFCQNITFYQMRISDPPNFHQNWRRILNHCGPQQQLNADSRSTM